MTTLLKSCKKEVKLFNLLDLLQIIHKLIFFSLVIKRTLYFTPICFETFSHVIIKILCINPFISTDLSVYILMSHMYLTLILRNLHLNLFTLPKRYRCPAHINLPANSSTASMQNQQDIPPR